MVSAARLECREPPAEAGELIGGQLGDGFGNFLDFMWGSIALKGSSGGDHPFLIRGANLETKHRFVLPGTLAERRGRDSTCGCGTRTTLGTRTAPSYGLSLRD